MPRIDPLQLLTCLNVLLTPSGGIKSELEVARLSSLMEKFSKKLVSKCVYLLILKSSDIQLLSKFMGLGGWNLIYNWLLHAVEAKNFPFLIELLEVIVICPVDIERLKSNPMPRQIKCLSKDYTVHPRVRDLASEIVKQWLIIVKDPSTVTAAPAVTSVPVPAPVVAPVSVAADNNQIETNDNQVTQPSVSSEESMEEDVDDGNYVKSPSPSSSSVADSDDADDFVPNKKPTKRPAKTVKKEKVARKKSVENSAESKAKSKLVASVTAKESKRGAIKLKIEKKKADAEEAKSKKERVDEVKPKKETVTVEERLKMKRKLKAEKEKEKFAKFKQERDKKDKTKDAVKDKAREDKIREDKYRNELSKLIPKSLDKIGRIPKKPKESVEEPETKAKDEASKPKSVDDKKVTKKDDKSLSTKPKETLDAAKREKEVKKAPAPPVPPKKPVSMSVEKRFAAEEKPKTVKAYNSKFRLTGLEQEVIPKPPPRKTALSSLTGSAGPSTSGTPPYEPEAMAIPLSPTVEKSALKRSPTKDVEIEPAEKKLKSPDVSMCEDKSSPLSSKNKKPFLQESDFFMNAMTTAIETQKESMRKRKKAPPPKSESEGKAEENGARKNSDVASSPTIKAENVKPAFKFYKETLDTSNDESVHESVEVPDIKIAPEELKALEDISNVKPKLEPSPPKPVAGLKSALSIFRGKKHPKKSVKWKRDDELEAVQYFEVDASERTNVVRTFWDMQMMERTKEREMLMVRKNADNDKMAVQTKWKPLTPIDIPVSSIVRGSNSQEKNIQYARERAVAPAIYFNKSMVPDTPAEPDLEIHPVTIPPVIPLDDISGSQDSITDFSAYKWPEPKLFTPDGSEMGMMTPGFMPNATGMPQPIFPPFPPPFGQPFFPGAPVPPASWTGASNGDQTQQNQNSMPMNWVPPPNLVPPPVGPPGMIAPPPFGMMGPPFPPIPGPGFPGGPNMFPPPNMNQPQMPNSGNGSTTPNSDSQSYSNSNNYSTNSESSGGSGSSSSSSRKWSSDDRYSSRKDGWKNNYSDRSRDKRSSSSSWRSSNRDSRLCRMYQKKGYCNISGCRFYHDDD